MIALFEKPSSGDLKFVEWLVSTVTETIGREQDNKVWPKFYQLRCMDQFQAHWEQYLEDCSVPIEPLFISTLQ